MKVTFTGGPLDGREEKIRMTSSRKGDPVYWPNAPCRRRHGIRTAGARRVVEYLYDGNGRASYVGGHAMT